MAAGQKFFNGIVDKATAQGTSRLIDSNGTIADAGNSVFNAVTGWLGNAKGAAKRYNGKTYGKDTVNDRLRPYERRLAKLRKGISNFEEGKDGNLKVKVKSGTGDDIITRAADNDEIKFYQKHKNAADALEKKIKWNKENGVVADSNHLSAGERFAGMFLDDEGKYSKARIAGGIAGSYMAANIVGNGSLGIPFLSTASWNR